MVGILLKYLCNLFMFLCSTYDVFINLKLCYTIVWKFNGYMSAIAFYTTSMWMPLLTVYRVYELSER